MSELRIYEELEQGAPEWLAARGGIVTASVIGQLISKGAPDAVTAACPKCEAAAGDPCVSLARKVPAPIKTLHDERLAVARDLPPVYRVADGDVARALTLTLVAERITGHVEMIAPSRDMERGTLDEPYARAAYSDDAGVPVAEVGFMVRDFGGYRIGYSPDGLVGNDGLIEIKSRKQKIQLRTVLADEVPAENMAQIQTGLLVSGRAWLDYVSYCGGMPLYVKRVFPDPDWFAAIIAAAISFEDTATTMFDTYAKRVEGRPLTERIDHFPELEISF